MPSEANKESLESFGTIIPHNGELLIAGGDVLTGHNPDNGKENWRSGMEPRPSRAVVAARAFTRGWRRCRARVRPQETTVYAFNPDKGADLIWKSEGQISNNKDILTSDVATPLYYEGKFFVVYGEAATRPLLPANPKPARSSGPPI